jgi:hypothetical protein
MSILGQLKKINAGQTAQLYSRHPLHDESPDAKLRYLSAVALACAPDRAPTDIERKAFLLLGESLGVEAQDATEQFEERASVQEDDIRRLFASIRANNLRWLYLVDVSWLHLIDGDADAGETDMANELAALLDVDRSRLALLHRLLAAVRDRGPRALVNEIPVWAKDPELQRHLPEVLRRCMPFVKMLAERWIDHGDGTVTDVRTAFRWRRGPVFDQSVHPDRPGVATVRFSADAGTSEAVVTALAVRPCEEIKPGDLLAQLATPVGPAEIRASVEGSVMEFLVHVGDRIRPNAEVMLLALSGGPAIMRVALPEDGQPQNIQLHRVLRSIERANAKEPPPGMSPWRLPTTEELNQISGFAGTGLSLAGMMLASMSSREFEHEIFAAVQGQKLLCSAAPSCGHTSALEQLRVFNGRASGDAVLLLCRSPLPSGSVA